VDFNLVSQNETKKRKREKNKRETEKMGVKTNKQHRALRNITYSAKWVLIFFTFS
jgi:hypothetical protein